MVTPVDPLGLMLGKVAPYLFLGLGETALILAIMRWAFAVPIQGSLVFLFGIMIVYLAALLAFGLFISTRAKTEMEAMQMAQMLVLPSIFLSGYIFPIKGMPVVLQVIGQILPAERHGNERPFVPGDAHLVRELQEEVCEARLDAPARHLGDAVRQLHDALGEPQDEAPNQRRVAFQQGEERRATYQQAGCRLDSDPGRRVGPSFIRHDGPDRVAGTEDLEDHFLPRGESLHDLRAPADDGEEEIAGIALGEERLSLVVGSQDP